MIRAIGRLFGVLARVFLVLVVVSLLASVAVTTGLVETGPDGDIDTPDPLPDWPFVWDLPVGDDPDVETDPRAAPEPDDPGTPVREDPGITRVELDGTTVTSAAIEERIHGRVNEHRADAGLAPLAFDDEIAAIARTYSHDMAERGYFSHVSPEGEGPADRFGDLHPRPCNPVGENLALVGTAGADDADAIASRIVEGWMDSEGHRENILTARWDGHGVGVYLTDDRAYATELFCDR